MTPRALQIWTPRTPVRAVALVLHGGRARSSDPTRPWQLAVLRMVPFDRALRAAGGPRGLAVARLRFGVRGWNDPEQSPVLDGRWALEHLRARLGAVPVGLVGHSMGARTALYVADDPAVRVVVALAPWIEPGDPTAPMTGRRLLVLHGDRDARTDPRASVRFVDAVRNRAASADYVAVPGETHAMLRRRGYWHRAAADYVVEGLLGAG